MTLAFLHLAIVIWRSLVVVFKFFAVVGFVHIFCCCCLCPYFLLQFFIVAVVIFIVVVVIFIVVVVVVVIFIIVVVVVVIVMLVAAWNVMHMSPPNSVIRSRSACSIHERHTHLHTLTHAYTPISIYLHFISNACQI